MSAKQSPKLNYWFVSIVLVVTLLLLFAFRIKTVNCEHQHSSAQELTQVCQELEQAFRGQSLLFSNLDQAAIWQKLLEREDYQESYHLVKVSKTFPSHVSLVLNSKSPDYRLKIAGPQNQSESYILNQSNRLKKDQSNLAVLTIVYQGEANLYEANQSYLEKKYHQLFLTWQQAIVDWEIPAKEIVWQSNELIKLDLGRSWLVVLDTELDFLQKMHALANILADEEIMAKIQGHQFLDMRFNLPVIRDQL